MVRAPAAVILSPRQHAKARGAGLRRAGRRRVSSTRSTSPPPPVRLAAPPVPAGGHGIRDVTADCQARQRPRLRHRR
ncbi:hypothetical protein QJS66_01200 [Kocuria rhizophila]|nr:hypothetical protein QJS66_01200 [Kocuria rhizophila]